MLNTSDFANIIILHKKLYSVQIGKGITLLRNLASLVAFPGRSGSVDGFTASKAAEVAEVAEVALEGV
jgi:hypothetical protein